MEGGISSGLAMDSYAALLIRITVRAGLSIFSLPNGKAFQYSCASHLPYKVESCPLFLWCVVVCDLGVRQ